MTMKSAGFHGWNHMKYTAYIAFSGRGVLGEICQISWWNLADFMVEIGRFHGSGIQRVLWWHLADFMHEIHWISWWNLPDFMAVKSARFHGRIWWISCESWQISWNQVNFMKSGGFHAWSQVDFMSDLEKCKLIENSVAYRISMI